MHRQLVVCFLTIFVVEQGVLFCFRSAVRLLAIRKHLHRFSPTPSLGLTNAPWRVQVDWQGRAASAIRALTAAALDYRGPEANIPCEHTCRSSPRGTDIMPCSALVESPCSSFSGGGTPHCRFPMAGRCSQGVAHRPLRLHSLRVSAVLSKDAPPSPSGPSGSDKRPFSSTPRDSGPSGAPSVGTQPPLADPALARQLNHLLRLPASATGALSTTAGDATTSSEPLGQQAPPGSSIPGPVAGPGAVYFFAYGTSLHRDALYDSGVRVLARDTAVVRDPAVQLVFRHRGARAQSLSHHAAFLHAQLDLTAGTTLSQ